MICCLQRVSLFLPFPLHTLPFSLNLSPWHSLISLAVFACISRRIFHKLPSKCSISRGRERLSPRPRQGSLMFSFVADQMRVQHALPAKLDGQYMSSKRSSSRQTDGHNVSINLAKKSRRRKANRRPTWVSVDTRYPLKAELSLYFL